MSLLYNVNLSTYKGKTLPVDVQCV